MLAQRDPSSSVVIKEQYTHPVRLGEASILKAIHKGGWFPVSNVAKRWRMMARKFVWNISTRKQRLPDRNERQRVSLDRCKDATNAVDGRLRSLGE